ncbi:MAG TPA: hypothetical protein DCM02_01075 [Flavobacterium sp.]|nr:hypothetical protein [Flavobacterium sp.]
MVIEMDKILTPAIATLITSLVGGAISALVSYWSVKKTFESNTKREIAKFNVLINGLQEEIDSLQQEVDSLEEKSSKVQSLENEVKKSQELFEGLKNYLEQYLENSNRTGNN